MKLKFKWIFTLLIALSMQFSFAQEKTVSGVVSDAFGPVPGANVLIKGTKTGVQTDFDGKYSIKAKQGDVLVFSFIGMQPQEKTVSSTLVNAKLVSSSVELDGVVVTALGIKREKKSLGYSTQEIKGSDLNSGASGANFLNELSGKAAGVSIRKNTNFGGSTNVVSRGVKNLTGDNQMLIVIDGMPINNSNTNTNFARK